MARNTITVIMSVHNGARYLREAISSILNQTEKEFEFIIVDDASTDDSASIIHSFNDPRIVLIKNSQNLGLTKSLNVALRKSNGTYIARMDADDIALLERLTVQRNFLDSHPDIVCVGSALRIIDEHGVERGTKSVFTDPDLLAFHMRLKNQIAHPTVMFRKDAVGEYDETFRYVQDYDLWSRLMDKGYKFSNIETPLLLYRSHTESITQGKTKDDAYGYAVRVMKRYMDETFIHAYHRHTIPDIKTLFYVLSTWEKLKKSAPKTAYKFVRTQEMYAIRWYIKNTLWKHR